MRVAVIIPAHDSARFLGEAIASVRAQTLAPDELVVVDDGSRDGSGELAEALGARCIRQENRGPGAARNRGVGATGAELLAFLDADDLFLPHKLERQVAHFADRSVVAACADAWIRRDGRRGAAKNAGKALPATLSFTDLLAGNPVVCSTVVVRREAFERAGAFDEDPALIATEDYDLWLRLARLGAFRCESEPLAEYRVHANSLSAAERFRRGVERIMDKVEQQWGHEPGVRDLARRRRAGVRVDAAWELLCTGERRRARAMLCDARRLGAWGWKERRMWLRTFFWRRSRGCLWK
jgi:glycosyltransferase involved in cell wall biosynthesis